MPSKTDYALQAESLRQVIQQRLDDQKRVSDELRGKLVESKVDTTAFEQAVAEEQGQLQALLGRLSPLRDYLKNLRGDYKETAPSAEQKKQLHKLIQDAAAVLEFDTEEWTNRTKVAKESAMSAADLLSDISRQQDVDRATNRLGLADLSGVSPLTNFAVQIGQLQDILQQQAETIQANKDELIETLSAAGVTDTTAFEGATEDENQVQALLDRLRHFQDDIANLRNEQAQTGEIQGLSPELKKQRDKLIQDAAELLDRDDRLDAMPVEAVPLEVPVTAQLRLQASEVNEQINDLQAELHEIMGQAKGRDLSQPEQDQTNIIQARLAELRGVADGIRLTDERTQEWRDTLKGTADILADTLLKATQGFSSLSEVVQDLARSLSQLAMRRVTDNLLGQVYDFIDTGKLDFGGGVQEAAEGLNLSAPIYHSSSSQREYA